MNKKLLIFFFITIGFTKNPDSLFINGTKELAKGNYSKSINNFESILSQGLNHRDLYYNLGNSYYRSGYYGQSIWAYEKGLELDPVDKDLSFNLSLANNHIKDRINIPEPFFILKGYRFLKNSLTFSQILSISSFFIFLAAGFYLMIRLFNFDFNNTPIQLFLFLSVISHLILSDKYFDNLDIKEGIIIQNEVAAFSGPFIRNDAVIFKIHEGIKVAIDSEKGDWLEISLLDGKKGWIKSNQLRVL